MATMVAGQQLLRVRLEDQLLPAPIVAAGVVGPGGWVVDQSPWRLLYSTLDGATAAWLEARRGQLVRLAFQLGDGRWTVPQPALLDFLAAWPSAGGIGTTAPYGALLLGDVGLQRSTTLSGLRAGTGNLGSELLGLGLFGTGALGAIRPIPTPGSFGLTQLGLTPVAGPPFSAETQAGATSDAGSAPADVPLPPVSQATILLTTVGASQFVGLRFATQL